MTLRSSRPTPLIISGCFPHDPYSLIFRYLIEYLPQWPQKHQSISEQLKKKKKSTNKNLCFETKFNNALVPRAAKIL